MTIEQLEIGKWYTIGGGDSNLKCLFIANNYAVFLEVSDVHYTVNTGFMSGEYIESWGEQFYEQDADYLEDYVARAIVPRTSWGGYESYAIYRDI